MNARRKAALGLFLAGGFLFGGTAQESRSDFEKIRDQFEGQQELTRRPLTSLGEKYREALIKLRNESQESADLDGLVIVKGEIERFDGEKSPAAEDSKLESLARLQKIYRSGYDTEFAKIENELSAANLAYRKKLEALVKKLTTAGKVDAALEVRSALENLAIADGEGPVDLEKGLVLHFRFDRESGDVVRDSSESRNDGRLMGDAKIQTAGNRGRHAALDGRGDFIEIPHHESLALTTDGTLSIWVRPKRLNNMRGLISKYQPVNSWTMRNWEGAQLRKVAFGDHNHNLLSKAELKYNQWTHVVATLRGGEASIFINGKLDSQGTRPTPLGVNDNPVRIGSCYDGRFLDGDVDDVRIYSRGLSAKEVARLFAIES